MQTRVQTIRAGTRDDEGDADGTREVIIATSLLVSRQNTTSREAWSPASEQQASQYVETLRREFIDGIYIDGSFLGGTSWAKNVHDQQSPRDRLPPSGHVDH